MSPGFAPAQKASVHHAKSGAGLRINAPHDRYEREADLVAEQLMIGKARNAALSLSQITMGALQRECSCGGKCDDCQQNTEKFLQRDAQLGAVRATTAPAAVDQVLRGAGHPLDLATRARMEAGFGRDFSNVRIFHDDAAASSARAVLANAYTVGNKIVFNSGRYAPASERGQRLLAHELAHVVQQDGHGPVALQRDAADDAEVADENEQEKKNDSLMARAIRAADARRWEEAARFANGLSPSDLRSFIFIYKRNPQFIKQLHIGAINAEGVGDKSAVALATEGTYKEVKHKEDIAYQKRLAKENGTPPPNEDGAPSGAQPKPLTVAEKRQKCEQGTLPGLMTFPLLMPGGMFALHEAPISAKREKDGIVVSEPLNSVYGDRKFRKDTKSLPLQAFTGGVKLAPDDVVRVRLYDNNEKTICVTGEQMLKIGEATDRATMLAALGTALTAASIMVPGAGQGVTRLAVGAANIALNEGLDIAKQENLVHAGLQDSVDWGVIAFDTLFQLVTLGVGSRFKEILADKAAARLAGTYSKAFVKIATESALAGAESSLQGAIRAQIQQWQHHGKKASTEQFLEQLATDFLLGGAMHVIMKAAHDSLNEDEGPGGGTKSSPPQEQTSAPKPQEHQHRQQPTSKPPEHTEHQQAKPQSAAHPPAMEPDSPKTPKALRKENAIAEHDIEPITPGEEKHTVIATKDGFGRCSDSPCPAIPIVYRKELDANPEFKKRYQEIRAKGREDTSEATAMAAQLAHDIEQWKIAQMETRNQATSHRDDAPPADPNRNTSREEWRQQEQNRRLRVRTGRDIDAAFDRALDEGSLTPRAKGTKQSGAYFDTKEQSSIHEQKSIPTKRWSKLDVDAAPTGDSPRLADVSLPLRPGETSAEALQRVQSIAGKKISEVEPLKEIWNDVTEHVKRNSAAGKLTPENAVRLYKQAQQMFWNRVKGVLPKGTPEAKAQAKARSEAAQHALGEAGFGSQKGSNAPVLQGTDPRLRVEEIRLSLDHIDEKAIGENWQKALDADNLRLIPEMANKERENIQQRHPELRPGWKPPEGWQEGGSLPPKNR